MGIRCLLQLPTDRLLGLVVVVVVVWVVGRGGGMAWALAWFLLRAAPTPSTLPMLLVYVFLQLHASVCVSCTGSWWLSTTANKNTTRRDVGAHRQRLKKKKKKIISTAGDHTTLSVRCRAGSHERVLVEDGVEQAALKWWWRFSFRYWPGHPLVNHRSWSSTIRHTLMTLNETKAVKLI